MLLTHAFSLLLYNASSFNTIMNTLTWYLCLVRLQMPSPKSVNIDVTIGELYCPAQHVCMLEDWC